MRRYIKITNCLLALSLLMGCGMGDPVESSDFKVQIKEMNLDGAKAMAHLQSGNPGTKASMEFEQEDALYLVYDNNEIRLPEIKFTVEAPDSWSEYDKKKWMEALHVSINEPMIKDFGEYIYVYSSLSYYIDGHGILDCPPLQSTTPGQLPNIPHSNTLIKKKDGLCLTVDDSIGAPLYWASYWASSVVKDSNGHAYFTTMDNGWKLCRLDETSGEMKLKSVELLNGRVPILLECNDNIYIAQTGIQLNPETGENSRGTLLGKVSSDLTYERTDFDGDLLVGLRKSGNDIYLFAVEEGSLSGSEENIFKVYNVTSRSELVASTTFVYGATSDVRDLTNNRPMPCEVISEKNGVFTCYICGSILQFDAKSGESTISALNEVVRGYLSNSAVGMYPGGAMYLAHLNQEGNYAELLKIDVQTGAVEQLTKFDVPEGLGYKEVALVDESQGRLRVTVNNTSMDVVDPEITKAYADAKHYGIDFGSYKVVNVVPLDDDLASSQN